jgi:SPP1 gp7 family putative phage head morphogenesis protein
VAATPTTLRLEQALRDLLDTVLDQQLRDLTAAWATAWDEVAPDLTQTLVDLAAQAKAGRIQRGMLVRSQRLTAVLAQIAAELEQLGKRTGVRIVGDLPDVVRRAYDAQRDIIGSQLPYALDQFLGPQPAGDRALAAIVRRSTERITSDLKPLSTQAYDAVRRELIRGVAVGSNPNHTALRIVQRAGENFNGGLSRAINISRTECVDAHRAAASEGQAANSSVLAGWRWSTHLSLRTCPACLAMNGKVFPLSQPGPEGHQQCRCARSPVTKSWADLGFAGMPEPVDYFPDARAWFQMQSDADQVKMLGADRVAMLRSGEISWEDMATLKHNDGWRDSWVMTPVRSLHQRASA